MLIIGIDYHPSDQCMAFADTGTGDCGERRLNHSDGETERFYRDLKLRGVSVRVGMEATGYSRWFERLLAELGIEVWIGDAAEIKTKRVRKQKTDRNDAQLLLKLLLENIFPRIWVPSPENRDLRQLLWHRHRMVQMRTRIMNQLQALAMNEGQRREKKLWSEQGRAQLAKLPLATWASRRRQDLLELLDRMNPTIEELTAAVAKGAAHEIRFADDAVLCFPDREDADKVMEVLPKRLAKYGLTLHSEKTRLVDFGRYAEEHAKRQGKKPATFDFLGFTHICARSRRGKFTVKVRTIRSIWQFYREVCSIWRKWLSRRTRGKGMTWEKYAALLRRHPLLLPRIAHPWNGRGVAPEEPAAWKSARWDL